MSEPIPRGTCSHCRERVPLVDGLIAYHDYPKPCRQVCRGAKMPPVEALLPKPAEQPPEVPAPDEVWVIVYGERGELTGSVHERDPSSDLVFAGFSAVRYVRAREGGR